MRSDRADLRCLTCGESLARRRATRFCSKRCNDIHRGMTRAEPLPDKLCALTACTKTFTPKSERQKCCCEEHGRAYCHVKAKAVGTPYSKGNRETKRLNDRKWSQRRRALTRDPSAELIDRDVIGDRDGWVCGLCSAPVDPGLVYPDPRSPSLDHVLPLAHGGRHIMSNVQIAHLTCNVRKGARVA